MIGGIIGQLGQGKTLFLTYLALLHLKQGEKVFSNYSIKGVTTKRIDQLLDLQNIYTGFVALDDIVPWLDCRQSMKSTIATWCFNKTRKRGLKIFYTCQVLGSVDYRLSALTNFFYFSQQIRFPTFTILKVNPAGSSLKRYTYTYSKNVYESYNTLEEVEAYISYKDLKDVKRKCETKTVFCAVLPTMYTLSIRQASVIYDLLKKKQRKLLKMLLKAYGYVMK